MNQDHCYDDGDGNTSGMVHTPSVPAPTSTPTPVPLISHDQHESSQVPGSLLSNNGNGYDSLGNACGPVAGCSAAEALGVMGYDTCMEKFAKSAGKYGYTPNGGIQPSGYAQIMQEILGGVATVRVIQAPIPADGLAQMQTILSGNNQVIVDYLSTNDVDNGAPQTEDVGSSYAHFARVYRVNSDEIQLVNSLGGNPLTISSTDIFSQSWANPEGRADYGRNHNVDNVNNWMLVISKP